MKYSEIRPAEGSTFDNNFRRDRGHGSGNGKTAGKGHKGQKARSGAPRLGFEGGQMPLYRRLPKRGFKNVNRIEYVILNVSDLERFNDGDNLTIETMIESGLIKNPMQGIKILGNGDIKKKLNVEACKFSNTAKQKIEAAGGSCKVCCVSDIIEEK